MTKSSAREQLPSPSGWRADIQGLRAIAVLAVVVFHADLPLPGGFTGVDMFFVISGYVITEMLLRQWHRERRIRLGSFYLRRFRRLVPALAVLVSVTVLASLVLLPPLGGDNRVIATAIGAMTISANVVIQLLAGDYFAASTQTNPLLHTWSLSVEEQFYLVFPLLVVVILGLVKTARHSRLALGITISVMSAISFGLALSAARLDLPMGEAILGFYSPISRAWEFGAGALVALAGPALSKLPDPLARIAAFFGLGFVVVGFFAIDESRPFPGVWTLLPVLGTVLLIVAGTGRESTRESRALGWKPLQLVGDWSYSIYLWHWPAVVFAAIIWPSVPWAPALAALLSLIPAVVSYYFVEQPLRMPKELSARRTPGVIATTLAVPAVAIGAVMVISATFLTPFLNERVGNPVELSISDTTNCLNDDDPFTVEWAESCWWLQDTPGEPIYLLGDSNAAHFDESLLLAAEELGRPLSILTAHSCLPLHQFDVHYDDGPVHDWCADYTSFLFPYIDSAEPGTVVLGWSDLSFWTDQRQYKWKDLEPVSGMDQKAEILRQALTETVTKLKNSGHEVVMTQPIPQFRIPAGGFEPEACALWQLTGGTCRQEVTLEELERTQGPHWRTVDQVGEMTGARVVSFTDTWCTDGVCSTNRGREIVYRDDIHISVSEARRLAPDFIEVLSPQR